MNHVQVFQEEPRYPGLAPMFPSLDSHPNAWTAVASVAAFVEHLPPHVAVTRLVLDAGGYIVGADLKAHYLDVPSVQGMLVVPDVDTAVRLCSLRAIRWPEAFGEARRDLVRERLRLTLTG